MITYKRINKAIHDGISLNPHKVKIIEVIKVIEEGAFSENVTEREIIAVVYPLKTNLASVDINNAYGASAVNRNYEMVADEKADIKESARDNTIIKCVEGDFKITFVNRIVVEDKIAGYQIGLERQD